MQHCHASWHSFSLIAFINTGLLKMLKWKHSFKKKTQYLLLLRQSHLMRAESRKLEGRACGGGAAKVAAAIAPQTRTPWSRSVTRQIADGDLLLGSASSIQAKETVFPRGVGLLHLCLILTLLPSHSRESVEERKESVSLQFYRRMPEHSKSKNLQGRLGLCKKAVTKLRFLRHCEPAIRISFFFFSPFDTHTGNLICG